MRKILSLAAIVASSAACFADDGVGKPEWFADYDKAVLAAKAQKKDLLVDFTGSDWCGWCIKLHEDVFEKPEFQSEAPKSYVLVALDFPHGEAAKAKVPNPKRNQELAEQYGIEGYPSVFVLTADGEVLARGGYEEGGPKTWLDHISTQAAGGRDAIAAATALEKEYAAAEKDDARAAVVGKAADRIREAVKSGAPVKKLASVARHGVELDPEGKTGLAEKSLKAVFTAGEGTDADVALAKKLDPKNAAGLVEHAIGVLMVKVVRGGDGAADFVAEARSLAAGELKDPEVYVPPLANACFVAKRQLKDDAAAKEIAAVLKKKQPDNERLQQFLAQILADDAK